MTEIQNKFWKLNSWNLRFVWNLDFVIWDLSDYCSFKFLSSDAFFDIGQIFSV